MFVFHLFVGEKSWHSMKLFVTKTVFREKWRCMSRSVELIFFFQWRTTCWLCLSLNNTIKLAIIFMKYKNELEMEEKKIFLKIYFPSGQKCVGNRKKVFPLNANEKTHIECYNMEWIRFIHSLNVVRHFECAIRILNIFFSSFSFTSSIHDSFE